MPTDKSTKLAFCFCFALFACAAASGASAQQEIRLLGGEVGQFEQEMSLAEHAAAISDLTDEDPATIALFSTETSGTVDLVFSFADEMVSPAQLALALPTTGKHQPPQGIDILASTVSPTSGFTSLRRHSIDPLAPVQTFKLRPVGAHWLMIRLYPGSGQTSVSLAGLDIRGTLGAPQTVYKFGETPAKAFEIIDALSGISGGSLALSKTEQEIFDAAREGDIGREEYEEIALFASGIQNPADRAAYIDRLETIENRIRNEIDISGTPSEIGANLLDWLHRNVLAGGYRERQTDLSVVLDDGVYNCVSSAVLYNALAIRLGLDARAIEVPDHAFSIVYDGVDHMDVETTTPRGFNPRRDRVAEFEALTGFEYIPQSNEQKRREIGKAGLAALIYYNHGVEHFRQGRYFEALAANFRAMSLDKNFASASTNALAAIGKWSASLSDSDQWEAAAEVAAVGTRLAPEDATLASNLRYVWQGWATSVASSGDYAAALALLDRANSEISQTDLDPIRAGIFIRPGEILIKQSSWAEALALADRGISLLAGPAQEDIRGWQNNIYLRWSGALIRDQDFDKAAEVLLAGLNVAPDDNRLHGNASYLGQEWARAAPSFEAGLATLEKFTRLFPTIGRLERLVEAYVMTEIRAAAKSGPIEVALAMAEQSIPVLRATGSDLSPGALVYEIYGHILLDQNDWEAAAAHYSAGVARYPENRLLARNSRYLTQQWQRAALESGGVEHLAVVNEKLRGLFPALFADPGESETEIVRAVTDRIRASDHAGALELLQTAQLLLSDKTYSKLQISIIEHEAGLAIKDQDWPRAAQIYADARLDLADPTLFSNNVTYIAQEWTQSAGRDAGAGAIAEVLETMVRFFPGDTKVERMGLKTLSRMISDFVKDNRITEAKEQISVARAYFGQEDIQALTIGLYRDLGDLALKSKRWSDALTAYETGLSLIPDARDLQRNIPFTIQEWSREALNDGGAPALLVAVEEIQFVLSNEKLLQDVLESVLSHHAEQKINDDDASGALELIDQSAKILTVDTLHTIKANTYDRWARRYFKDGEWARAVDIYEQGLGDIGKSGLLENNKKYAESKI